MTQHLSDELQDTDNELIERARRALSPRDADQARVLAALSERLFAPHAGGPVPSAAPSHLVHGALPSLDAAGTSLTGAAGSSRSWGWVWKGALPLVSVTVLGLLWLTSRADHDRKPARGDAPPQVSAAVSPAPFVKDVELLAHEQPASPAPEAPPAPKPDKKHPARKRCHAANGGERPCPAPPAPTALAAAATSDEPAKPAESSLRQELEALRKAERALREHQPAHALEVLEAYEHAAAGSGAMQEERNAASTVARCALAADGGEGLYQSFVRRYPSSAYAARVRQTCVSKP